MSTPPKFVAGWYPDVADAARARMAASGVPYARARARFDIPAAYSLSAARLRHMEQGQAGTCWVHAAVQLCEVTTSAGKMDAFPVCRRLVGWLGKQYEGGGNPSEGGAVSDSIRALADAQGGAAHEALLPYTDDPGQLGQQPPQAVFADARPYHLSQVVDVPDDEAARSMIAGGHAVANGIWWPFNWDDNRTFMDTIGQGAYGHALTEIGYVRPGVFDQYDWFQLDNWHGLLYPPLPPELAAKVPGYKPVRADATSDFWVRADIYKRVRNFGDAERLTATGADGWHLLDPAPSADPAAWEYGGFA